MRARRRLVAALGVVALALFLAFHVRDDLAYALSSSDPQDLGRGPAVATAPADRLPLNRYVRLAGVPDRESAVVLEPRGSGKFQQFFRLLATSSRIFVNRSPDPLPLALADRDVFVGRLVRFGDLSFESSIREHFAKHVTATHLFKPQDVIAGLVAGRGPLAVSDLAGDEVTLGPNDELVLSRVRPDEFRIDFPKARYPDVAAARAIVEGNAGRVLSAVSGAADAVEIVAVFPAAVRDKAFSAIGDPDRRIKIRQVRSTLKVPAGALRGDPSGLAVQSADGRIERIPASELQSIRTVAPVLIPDGALLLLEGDRPRDHLKILAVVALLLAFAAANILSLRRSV